LEQTQHTRTEEILNFIFPWYKMEAIIDRIITQDTIFLIEVNYIDDDAEKTNLIVKSFKTREKAIECLDKLNAKGAKLVRLNVFPTSICCELTIDVERVLLE
jgi:hypothetical protein